MNRRDAIKVVSGAAAGACLTNKLEASQELIPQKVITHTFEPTLKDVLFRREPAAIPYTYEDILREGKRIAEKWQHTGLLEGIEPQHRETLAILLENQRMFNEIAETTPTFKRLSIPILRRMFSFFHSLDCVSWQPALGTQQLSRFANKEDKLIDLKFNKAYLDADIYGEIHSNMDIRTTHSLQNEAEAVANDAQELAECVERNIFNNLTHRFAYSLKSEEWLFEEALDNACKNIYENTGEQPNWVWIKSSKQNEKKFEKFFKFKNVKIIKPSYGLYSFVDVLIGYKDNHRAVLNFHPYILLERDRDRFSNEKNKFQTPIIMRYGIHLNDPNYCCAISRGGDYKSDRWLVRKIL